MRIAIVVDMNLSPEWVRYFEAAGISAVHWTSCGPPTAPDSVIMDWATKNRHIVFTLDLDFAAALAMTHATAPSVLQVRGSKVLPEHIGPIVVKVIGHYAAELESGALVVVEPTKSRVRVLPF
jgi:predicted nuclease of predicted toxin-antitoxin system